MGNVDVLSNTAGNVGGAGGGGLVGNVDVPSNTGGGGFVGGIINYATPSKLR